MSHVVSPGRKVATAPILLADVKDVGRRLGVTVNDMVLAVTAGALRELLLRFDGAADAPLIAGVPASLNTPSDRLTGSEFSYTTPSLPVHIADPFELVLSTASSANIAKEKHRLLGPTPMASWMVCVPPPIAPTVFRWQSKRLESSAHHELTISNVPGPEEQGHIESATITEIYSVGPLVAGSGMNITV